ncbi:ABC transporter ATP-binding protein [Desulfuromonas acetexigens]|uniref:ABC transporter ATP-binding protein n=1 Tax=Trichloromonas acetexigens TaxID=38815 RepID=A0A550J6Q4_9BACT|nr:ABC transporter ATP-binding protein [Desulfuromonas acetexigens]TRO78793.1 ABC transporter ATP-binding protein [Desulfuromonas acetexigens]
MTANDTIIRLTDIGKIFSQGGAPVEVLKGISLDIAAGEFIALLGTSGSGKSTLMHILGLLDRPTAGSYLLGGRDVAQLADDQLSELRNQMVGFIFQSFYLIPYVSARENVMLPGLYSHTPGRKLKARAEELLALVGLADRMEFKPSQLSGGQQQRVAIARALVNDPQVLLADEPTGQLDSKTSVEILELLSAINRQGRTVILVTHDQQTAAYAQRRIVLDDGRIRNS